MMFAVKYLAALLVIFVAACFVNLRINRLDVSPQVAVLPEVGNDPDAYLANAEAAFSDITEGTQKRIIWAAGKGKRTDRVVVYVHGFSATSEEIRPVPDQVAKAMGANLYFTRLTGHGRPGEEMGKVYPEDWVRDLAESIAVAKSLGDRVILVSTSTGGTLATVGHAYPNLMADVAGIVFVSPNFGLQYKSAVLGRLPFARQWAKYVAGQRVSWEPQNEEHGRYWTTSYPPHSIIPMMGLVSFVEKMDLSAVSTPALFYYSDKDQVVKASITDTVFDRWGGQKLVVKPELSGAVDPNAHVITGDILSPAQTDHTVSTITEWAADLK